MPSTLWIPLTVTPSISSPNLWLRKKSPCVLVSPFRVSRLNLTAMGWSPGFEGSGELDALEHDFQRLDDVARGPRVQAVQLPLLRPAIVEVHPRGFGALVGEVDDADALALDVAVVDRLEPVVELAVRPEPIEHQRAHLLAPRPEPLEVIVGVLVPHHLVLVLEPLHLHDAAGGDAVDLDGEPALLDEVPRDVLRGGLQHFTAELHGHRASPVSDPAGSMHCNAGRGPPSPALSLQTRLPGPSRNRRRRSASRERPRARSREAPPPPLLRLPCHLADAEDDELRRLHRCDADLADHLPGV